MWFVAKSVENRRTCAVVVESYPIELKKLDVQPEIWNGT